MPVGVGGEGENPLVAVEDAGEGVRGETFAQRLGSLTHIGDVSRTPFLEGPNRLFPRREAPLRADPLRGLAPLRPIAQKAAHEIVLAPDLAALLLGGMEESGGREEPGQRQRPHSSSLRFSSDTRSRRLEASSSSTAADRSSGVRGASTDSILSPGAHRPRGPPPEITRTIDSSLCENRRGPPLRRRAGRLRDSPGPAGAMTLDEQIGQL